MVSFSCCRGRPFDLPLLRRAEKVLGSDRFFEARLIHPRVEGVREAFGVFYPSA